MKGEKKAICIWNTSSTRFNLSLQHFKLVSKLGQTSHEIQSEKNTNQAQNKNVEMYSIFKCRAQKYSVIVLVSVSWLLYVTWRE